MGTIITDVFGVSFTLQLNSQEQFSSLGVNNKRNKISEVMYALSTLGTFFGGRARVGA